MASLRSSVTRTGIVRLCLAAALFSAMIGTAPTIAQSPVPSRLVLRATGSSDQDDMTFWLHPTDLSQSTIIASDKAADRLFVYDLNGATLQVVPAGEPGNIDIRYGFSLAGQSVDIVAFNERNTNKIRVYKVDPVTRLLQAADNGSINSGSNYGFSLYKSPVSGKFYAFTGPPDTTRVVQFELIDNGNGQIAGVGPLRQFPALTQVEGMVADDETGFIYIGEEAGGIWKFGAEPGAPTTGVKIASTGQNGLEDDVEGLTIYYMPGGQGYLLASSQGNDTFKVYDRQAPHTFRGTFSVAGVSNTDGIDVVSLPLPVLGAPSQGLFASHNGTSSPYPVVISRWDDIANLLGLQIDTSYWDPRGEVSNTPPPLPAADTADTSEDASAIVIDVLANDLAADSTPLTGAAVVAVTQPANGTATLNADSTVGYTPRANFFGPDRFTYSVRASDGGRAVAEVFVTVHAVNDAPVASDLSTKTPLNTSIAVTLPALDPDKDPLTYLIDQQPANGALSGLSQTSPNATYTPNQGFSGVDSFTFHVNDGTVSSNIATVAVTVNPTPAPLATDGFESGNYTGGTGWNGGWTRSGETTIRTNTDGPQEGARHVRLRSSSGFMRRSLNLTGATSVRLTFWAKVQSFESSDRARVRVSTSNGSNPVTVLTLTPTQSNNTYRFYDISLGSFAMTSTFTIIFDAEMSSTNDSWFIDNIRITGVR
jgi:3-phytase